MLDVRDLTVTFGGFRALDRLSMTVAGGRLNALIGPNGAGKTTLFNVVSGLLAPAAGEIAFEGRTISGLAPEAVTATGLVRTFQVARGFTRLTVFEHLMLYDQHNQGEALLTAFLRPAEVRRREAEIAERALAIARRLRLDRVIDYRVTDISGGQKKLLEIGRGLMAEPRMLLLDEPAAGVAPTLAEEIGERLRSLVADGLAILLIEHDMALVERIADHVIVLAQGRHLAEGSFAAIRDDPVVQEAYLGVEAVVDAVGL